LLGWSARIAVIFFFVLSGFAIATSILRGMGRSKSWDWFDYAIRRVSRIYPPYVIAVAASAVLVVLSVNGWLMLGTPVSLNGRNVDLQSWLRALVFLDTGRDSISTVNIAIWSLRLEVALYIIAGLIAAGWCLGPTKRLGMFAAACGLTVLCCCRLSFMTVAVVLFGCGAAAAIFPPTKISSWLSGCVVIAVLSAVILWPDLMSDTAISLTYQALLGIPIALWLRSLAAPTAQRNRWPSLIIASGAWSYTLYIMHSPTLIGIRALLGDTVPSAGDWSSRIAMYIFYFVTVNAICWALARVFERPSTFAMAIRSCGKRVGGLFRPAIALESEQGPLPGASTGESSSVTRSAAQRG
jgi:peptidoglycan/LPS O-acetylase OafA/YrhL